MKMETKNNLKIILIIVGLFSVSVILFLFKGYEAALYYTIIGIPLFFIAFAYQYIKQLRTSRHDPGLTLKTQETEKIAYDFKNLHSVARDLNRTYGLQVDDIDEIIKTLANKELPLIGINVVETDGTYTTNLNEISIQKIDLDTIDNVAQNINSLDSHLKSKIKDFTNIVSQAYLSYINTLKNAGYTVYPSSSRLQAEINNKSLETNSIIENARYLDNITSIFRDIVSSCLTEAKQWKQKAKELGKDVSSIELEMNSIEGIIQSKNYRDFEKGIASLTRIKNSLESITGGDFSAYKTDLLAAIGRILVTVESKIDNDYTQKLLILEERVKRLESASKIGELQQIEPQIIPTANEIVKEVYTTLKNNETTILQANFPQRFYPERQPIEKEYDELLNETNVRAYSEKFSSLLKIMIPVMEKSGLKAKIIGIYGKIETIIKSELDAKGKITAAELKVKNPEEFMELYSYFHPDALYDGFQKILTTSPQVTRNLYKVSLRVLNKDNQPLNGAEISIKLDDKIIKKEVSDKDGNAILVGLNKGSYKLLIKQKEYKSQSKEIELDNDLSIEIKLKEVPLGEKLCKDKEESLQKSLVKFRGIIQKEIESKKHILSTNDKLKAEYAPCLLYLWSKDNESVKFIKYQKDYMVYDFKKFQKDIETLLEENVEVGKKKKIQELIKDYLSVQLPVEEIIAIIEGLKKESDYYKNVEYDSKLIWKNS